MYKYNIFVCGNLKRYTLYFARRSVFNGKTSLV
nr:MAG TPA: hypothetical protein [Caudoviricetes sp.]